MESANRSRSADLAVCPRAGLPTPEPQFPSVRANYTYLTTDFCEQHYLIRDNVLKSAVKFCVASFKQ